MPSSRPEYALWKSARSRCHNTRDKRFYDYGGRGIRMCDGWRGSFASFYADVGPRPEGLSLDRRNNDRGYECGHCDDCLSRGLDANCQWVTKHEQALNRRPKKSQPMWVPVTFRGETKSLTEWARTVGTTTSHLGRRIRRLGVDAALATPIQRRPWVSAANRRRAA